MKIASSLSQRDRRTLLLGGAILAALLVLSRGLPLWSRWSDDAIATAAELADDEAEARRTVASAGRAGDSLAARSARFRALAPALVDGATPGAAGASLAGLLSGAAAVAGVRVASLQLRPDSASAATFTLLAVRAELVGDARGLAAMLSLLERGPTLIAVRELSINQPEPAAPPERAEMLRVQLLIEALALNRPLAPARGAGGAR